MERGVFTNVSLIVLIMLCPAIPLPVGAQPLIYAPLPLENPAHTQARNQPLADLLGELLGRPVEMRLYPDHAALLDGLTRDEVAFAELGPLPLLLAKERMSMLTEVAVFREADGRADYRCVLVAPVDGVQSLPALADMFESTSVALTREESTCGPTVTFSLLASADLDPGSFDAAYLGGHDNVALAVLRQQFHLGGLKENVARRFHGLGLRVLAASDPVPGLVLVVRPDSLSVAEIESLRSALLNLSGERLSRLQNGRYGFELFQADLQARLETMRTFSAPFLGEVSR